MDPCSQASAIHAVPAQSRDCGFRLLVLRQYHLKSAPPAFALIEQRILRAPQRLSRHGTFFANTFLPEIMSWLGEHLGRPSSRDAAGMPHRNPRWPDIKWHGEERTWPDGMRTTEWLADVTFHDEASWTSFRARWHGRLWADLASDEDHSAAGDPPRCMS
jgi:hypothetical protein